MSGFNFSGSLTGAFVMLAVYCAVDFQVLNFDSLVSSVFRGCFMLQYAMRRRLGDGRN